MKKINDYLLVCYAVRSQIWSIMLESVGVRTHTLIPSVSEVQAGDQSVKSGEVCRKNLTQEQTKFLDDYYLMNQYPDVNQKIVITSVLLENNPKNLAKDDMMRKVSNWFVKRRSKHKSEAK